MTISVGCYGEGVGVGGGQFTLELVRDSLLLRGSRTTRSPTVDELHSSPL